MISVGGHGIEPWTSFLSGMRSTTELPAQIVNSTGDLILISKQLGAPAPKASLSLAVARDQECVLPLNYPP